MTSSRERGRKYYGSSGKDGFAEKWEALPPPSGGRERCGNAGGVSENYLRGNALHAPGAGGGPDQRGGGSGFHPAESGGPPGPASAGVCGRRVCGKLFFQRSGTEPDAAPVYGRHFPVPRVLGTGRWDRPAGGYPEHRRDRWI